MRGGEADLVVLRPADGLPDGFLPERLNGLWINLADADHAGRLSVAAMPESWHARALPTGRFEVRDDDGAVAEVWEVRQADGV